MTWQSAPPASSPSSPASVSQSTVSTTYSRHPRMSPPSQNQHQSSTPGSEAGLSHHPSSAASAPVAPPPGAGYRPYELAPPPRGMVRHTSYGSHPSTAPSAPARPYDRYYDYPATGYSYPPRTHMAAAVAASPPSHHHYPRQAPLLPPQPHPYGASPQSSSYRQPMPSPDRASPMRPTIQVDSFRTGGCTCKKSRCLKLYCQCFSLSTTCGPKCKCQTCHNTPLHPEAIEQARKTIMERNPSAFDDKFRSTVPTPATPSPYRGSPYGAMRHPQASPPCTISGGSAWPPSAYVVAPSPPTMMATPSSATSTTSSSGGNSNKTSPPLRVNKFGCKCRRSFCLKKYCECYQNSIHCGLNCRCTNCKNFPPTPEEPPADGHGPAIPAASSSPRCVSAEVEAAATPSMEPVTGEAVVAVKAAVAAKTEGTAIPAPAAKQPTIKEDNETAQDRMAIMAAVAMTELFGGPKEPRRVSMDHKAAAATAATSSTTVSVTPENPASPAEKMSTTSSSMAKRNPVTPSPEAKRKLGPAPSVVSSPEKSDGEDNEEDASSTPPVKKIRVDDGKDSESPMSSPGNSRHPSPVSVMTPQHGPAPYPHQLPYHHHLHLNHHRVPPPTASAPQYHTTPHAPPHHHHHHHHKQPHGHPQNIPPYHHQRHYAHAPPPPGPRGHYGGHRAYSNYYHAAALPPPPHRSTSKSYEDVIKSSGLPKALSFRKICSKCGKTRGEHGELGFGNKCIFQECGKCGAGTEAHQKAGSPMGILCRLLVEQGATPGAAVAYDRKIRDLAARAELQKTLQEDKRERVERLAAQQPFLATN